MRWPARQRLHPIACRWIFPALRGKAVTIASRRAATASLAQGGALVIFPAGGVASADAPFGAPALDLPWINFTARLALMAHTSVVPVHFSGQNSWLFQLIGRVNGTLRMSLLCRETARKIGKRIDVAIGEPIARDELAAFTDRAALVAELRRRTFDLAGRPDVDWMKTAPPPPE